MGLEDYLEVVWPRANVFLGSGDGDEKFLTRPYGRVDRPKLKRMLLQRCIDSGVTFHMDKVGLPSASRCTNGDLSKAEQQSKLLQQCIDSGVDFHTDMVSCWTLTALV